MAATTNAKPSKPGVRKSPKKRPVPPALQDYFDALSEESRQRLLQLRDAVLVSLPPDVEERIGYGIPGCYIDGKSVLYISGWKQHVSIHPVPSGDQEFLDRVAPHIAGKGTLRFLNRDPLPTELITEVAAVRFADHTQQLAAKAASKKPPKKK